MFPPSTRPYTPLQPIPYPRLYPLLKLSVPAEHRFCLNLLKAYGALSAILLASDLLSLGAILGQVREVVSLSTMTYLKKHVVFQIGS